LESWKDGAVEAGGACIIEITASLELPSREWLLLERINSHAAGIPWL